MKWILGKCFGSITQVNERLIAKTLTIIVGFDWQQGVEEVMKISEE
jgi:hypothetical protein